MTTKTNTESRAVRLVANQGAEPSKKHPEKTVGSVEGPEKFGMLTLLSKWSNGKHTMADVRCECGSIKTVRLSHLKSGTTKSCGCERKRFQIAAKIKNGFYLGNKTCKIVNAYNSMMSRCYREADDSFKRYGGRGVRVCDRWRNGSGLKSGRDCFIEDMGNPPTPKHSLDRINFDGDYGPENCRWATLKEQANNRSNNAMLNAFGRTQTFQQWLDQYSMSYAMLKYRISKMGMTPEQALTTPKLRTKKK